MFWCLWLLLAVSRADQTILTQQPGSPNPANRIISQHFTDSVSHNAFLYACDDFVVPSAAGPNVTALWFNFTLARTRSDANPQSITLQLLTSTPATAATPSQSTLFSQTYNNSALWNNAQLNAPFTLSFVVPLLLQNGTGVAIPRDQRLWVTLFATGPRDLTISGLSENCLYWMTAAQSALVEPYLAGTNISNSQYFFRDVTNVLGDGFTQWTSAEAVEPSLDIASGTRNMAFSLTLMLSSDPPLPEPEPEPVPEPTAAPTGNITGENDNNSTVNGTQGVTGSSARSVALGILIPLAIGLCILVACYVWLVKRKRDRKKLQADAAKQVMLPSQQQQQQQQQIESAYVTRMVDLDSRYSTTTSESAPHDVFGTKSRNPLRPVTRSDDESKSI